MQMDLVSTKVWLSTRDEMWDIRWHTQNGSPARKNTRHLASKQSEKLFSSTCRARERDATFINRAFSPNSYGWNESSSTLALSAHARSQKSGQHSGCGSWNPGLNLALGVSEPELLSLKSYTYIHKYVWDLLCITIYICIYIIYALTHKNIHLSTWTCTFYWNDANVQVPQNTI